MIIKAYKLVLFMDLAKLLILRGWHRVVVDAGRWNWQGPTELDSVVKADIWSHTSICRLFRVHSGSELFEGRWRKKAQ